MPTWLLILVAIPPILWTAYCFLAWVHGVECHGTCSVNFALIGLALVGYGLYAESGAAVGVGALLLFFTLLGFGVHRLVRHLGRRRQAEDTAGQPKR